MAPRKPAAERNSPVESQPAAADGTAYMGREVRWDEDITKGGGGGHDEAVLDPERCGT
jgi:hypothetical protein